MKLLRSLEGLPAELRACAVSIGNFDGVHRGHARLVERLLARARQVGGRAVVLSFDPHPVRLLRPLQAPPPLTWTDRKADLLAQLGVDALIAYPTDEALLQLSARDFFDQILRGLLDARAVVEGPNFFFGRDRAGNIEVLSQLASEARIVLEVVEPVQVGGQYVSSSRIRQLIAQGAMAEARQLLTEPYRVRGMVSHGAGRGARIGFPTANVGAIDTLLPQEGVYAGWGWTRAGRFPAAINIGGNPTFGETALKVEAHLIGFQGALYGQPIELDFLTRLRGTRAFADVASLVAQLHHDVARAEREAAAADSSVSEDS